MQIQGKNLPAVQGARAVQAYPGSGGAQLKLLVAAARHSTSSNEIRVKAVSIALTRCRRPLSSQPAGCFPPGTFIDIYV